MSDALQVAERRRKEYKMAISKKENEIVELKERIEDLDNFLEFGQALVSTSDDNPRANGRPEQAPAKAAPQAEDTKSEAGDDWNKSEEKPSSSGIAQVLSQRAG